jgi:hypothetical protein
MCGQEYNFLGKVVSTLCGMVVGVILDWEYGFVWSYEKNKLPN